MKVSLLELEASPRRHMVIYSLRDHFSSMFYAEVRFGPELPSIIEFLARAWSPKKSYPFHGLPEMLILPRTLIEAFPGLPEKVGELGIEIALATSGFEGGIRDIRTVETNLRFHDGNQMDQFPAQVEHILVHQANSKARAGEMSKRESWNKYATSIRELPTGWCWQTIRQDMGPEFEGKP